MKKILLVLCFISVAFCTTGCNLYFKVKQNDVLYYGAYNARDMIHADVKLYQQNSDVFCDGVVFLNSPSRAITLKNDLVDAKMLLSCNDGKLLDSLLQLRKGTFDQLVGEGYDQLNNKYEFQSIEKSEFKSQSGIKKVKFINDNSDSLIKY